MLTEHSDIEKSTDDFRGAWRLVTWAGLLGSGYFLICVGGAPRIKFLTELGATAFHFGLIAGFATLSIALQILGSIIANRLDRRKPVWMVLAITHRLAFTGVLLAPLMFGTVTARMAWIIVILLIHDVLAQLTVPMWMSWMADLMPRETMTRHWASRQRFITAANIVIMILLALGFHYFEMRDQVVQGFVVVSFIGIALGVADILLFFGVPEPPNERLHAVPWREIILQPIKDPAFRPFVIFMGYWHFAAFFAAPFIGLYLFEVLEMNALTVQLLATSGAVGVVLTSQFWGLLCDTYGYRPILKILAVAKCATPLLFLVAPLVGPFVIPYVALAMFADGVMNSGLMLSMQGVMLKLTPRRNRSMYIAATNFFAIGIMATIAPMVAGRLIDVVNEVGNYTLWALSLNGYQVAFALSVVLRALAPFLARRMREDTSLSVREMLAQIKPRELLQVTHHIYKLHESPDDGERLAATRALGRLANPMAISELTNALQDASRPVRAGAAAALGLIGRAEAVEPLIQALFSAESGIQPPAARALGHIGGEPSLKALLANLDHPDPQVLSETVEALGHIGDDSAILPLIFLYDRVESDETRHRILAALMRLGRMGSIAEVAQLLPQRRPLGQVTTR